MRTQLIVGVSGGSGAGKHLIIHQYLLPALEGAALILEHDWYYLELDRLYAMQGVSKRADINYDRPDAYENSLLIQHLEALGAGRAIELYPFQKGVGLRTRSSVRLEPAEVVIVDGMMLFAVPELVSLMAVTAYVHAEDDVRLERRIKRDLSFSTVEESVARFNRDVLPAHRKYVEPSCIHARFMLDNSRNGESPRGVEGFVTELVRRLELVRRSRSIAAERWAGQPCPAPGYLCGAKGL